MSKFLVNSIEEIWKLQIFFEKNIIEKVINRRCFRLAAHLFYIRCEFENDIDISWWEEQLTKLNITISNT